MTDVDFAGIWEIEERKYNREHCTLLKDIVLGEKGNHTDIFWHIWSGKLDDPVHAINAAIMKDINAWYELYQRKNM